MPYYYNPRNGVIVWVEEGTKMIPLWILITEEEKEEIERNRGGGGGEGGSEGNSAPENVKTVSSVESNETTANESTEDENSEIVTESTEELPTYATVEELRKKADKSNNARTERGAIYTFSEEKWRKVED